MFRIFQISLENYFKIKFYLYKYLRLQSSEIENWPYYELEYTVENLADDIKKRQKAQEEEEKEYSSNYLKNNKNNPYSNLGKTINIPKMPSLGISGLKGLPKL